MVKLYGPLMSLDASGTLADAITFSKWKGRNYARTRVIPSNPKSGAQTGRRAMFQFLTQFWAENSAGRQATWQTLADQLTASRFNAFISHNMERWHNFNSPTMSTPPEGAETASAVELSGATWEENRIELVFDAVAIAFDFGIAIFAKLGGAVTPAVGNTIIVTPHDSPDVFTRYWTPPEVGTWHFSSICFSRDGFKHAAGAAVNAVPP